MGETAKKTAKKTAEPGDIAENPAPVAKDDKASRLEQQKLARELMKQRKEKIRRRRETHVGRG